MNELCVTPFIGSSNSVNGHRAQSRPRLDDVTLVAVTSVAIGPTVRALEASMQQADFAEVLLLSDQPPGDDAHPGITWRSIERLESRADYSRFMLHRLVDYISSRHALCVQWDGFVLQGEAWDDSFIDYDYIGAVWPHFRDGFNVGNGGFSLRSRRLLEACTKLPFDGRVSEDVIISRLCRPELERLGIRFAPEAVAMKFAYERAEPTTGEFGFHGAFNLVRYLSARDADETFHSLEPGMVSRKENIELLGWALTHGRLRLAFVMFSRLLKMRPRAPQVY